MTVTEFVLVIRDAMIALPAHAPLAEHARNPTALATAPSPSAVRGEASLVRRPQTYAGSAATLLVAGLLSLAAAGGWLVLAPGAPVDLGGTLAAPVPRQASVPIPAPPAAAPTRLTFTGGPGAEVVAVRVGPGGQLNVPADPDVLGWWQSGARPGAGRGGVIVVGHVDSRQFGVGVFARLAALRIDDRVSVSDADGQSHAYRVAARQSYPKATLPAEEVFSQTVAERLVLITCTGRYDRSAGGYPNNLVVYAVPAPLTDQVAAPAAPAAAEPRREPAPAGGSRW